MSIASAIQAKQQQVADSYTAVSNKGGTLPATQNLTNLATAINSIPSGGGGGEKYGANVNTFLGNADANGILQSPTEQSDLIFTGIKDLATQSLSYRFYGLKVKSVSFPDLITISNPLALEYCFRGSQIQSASFPLLSSITGGQVFNYCFYDCPNLTSALFPILSSITGDNGMAYCFFFCPSLTSVSFPMLSSITGQYAMNRCFYSCSNITDIYYPALTASSFGSYIDQFMYMMTNTGNTTTHTLHFPSNLESTISGLTGYPLFGGTSGYIVCAFDLPATE